MAYHIAWERGAKTGLVELLGKKPLVLCDKFEFPSLKVMIGLFGTSPKSPPSKAQLIEALKGCLTRLESTSALE